MSLEKAETFLADIKARLESARYPGKLTLFRRIDPDLGEMVVLRADLELDGHPYDCETWMRAGPTRWNTVEREVDRMWAAYRNLIGTGA
jgi:hypothetical protein